MSQPADIPRLLATLVGVEPPAPTGPPRVVGLPAPVTKQADPRAPHMARERIGRRPPEREPETVREPERDPETAAPVLGAGRRRSASPLAVTTVTRGSGPGGVRTAVRGVLGSSSALRTGFVVAEILAPPRALRPHGTDAPA